MLKLNIKSFIALLITLVAFPQVSFAYLTTDQKAIQINENTLLYTVTYRFGFLNRELRMSVGAERGLQADSKSPYVGYTLLKDGNTPVLSGETYGAVLSDAKIVGDEYYLPEGRAANFTLVTLVKLGEGFVPATESDYNLSMQITSLPFTMINKAGKKIPGRVEPLELQSYITPELDLK